ISFKNFQFTCCLIPTLDLIWFNGEQTWFFLSYQSSYLLPQLPIFHNLILDSPELLPELPSDKPIEGLTSVVETLSAFQRVLHSLPKGHVTQLRSDVSKLQSDLEERMSSLQCPHRKTSTEKTLEAFLKNNRMFHITLGHVALDRLQKYLQRLTHNLDKLKTC
uniref:Leptin n=1 Tax=Astyanax mexicanus TaxID=7994 RepID=A0A8B9HFK5_ASTMX